MDILCTRPGCDRLNSFPDLNNRNTLQTAQQKFCTRCGMPLILAQRYLPVKLLGQGGFGAAFLAMDRFTPTMRFCVVKQFQPTGNLNAQQLAIAEGLFEREATVLEQLGNKNEQIPNLYAFFPLIVENPQAGKPDQFFYLVQEFINGENLEQELARTGQFSESAVKLVLTEILKVLQFVHSKGSIHRDIKPSNIMRDQEGKLYLLDFGAVKQIAGGNVPGGGSTGIYSMGFAPPEQMAGNQVYPATDLYALGVTCLYLLTGKFAQDLYDPYHTTWNWRTYAPKVSDRLGQVLDRLLLPAPKDRYQSAIEVLEALEEPIANPVIQPPTPPQPPTPSQPQPQAPSTHIQPPKQPPFPSTMPVSPPNQASPVKHVIPGQPPVKPSFSTLDLLMCAAFTGFEGSLIGIAATSLFPTMGISAGITGMAIAGMMFAQWKRVIEKWDFLFIAGFSLIPFFFLTILHKSFLIAPLQKVLSVSAPIFQNPFFVILIIASFLGLALIAIVALFRLIYQLLISLL
jgi:serine/threonine-protein kinase